MRILIIFLTLVFVASTCSNNMELITNKDESGAILEEYTVDAKTKEKEGLYKSYDNDGRLIEESNYKADELEGERRIYYENGAVESIETFVSGIHSGRYLSFFENGKVQLQGAYIDGKMDGEWRAYYENGQLKEIVAFSDNNENGPFIEYYENGNLKAKGTYLNGDQEHGPLEIYDEDGKLERKMDCQNGVCKTVWSAEKKEEQ